MLEIRVDRRVLIAVGVLFLVVVPLAVGLMLGGAFGGDGQVADAPDAASNEAPAPELQVSQPTIEVASSDPLGTELPPDVHAAVPRIDLEVAREKLGQDNVVFADTRTEGEYVQGHIEGAISLPLDQVERRLSELPQGAEIILYCA